MKSKFDEEVLKIKKIYVPLFAFIIAMFLLCGRSDINSKNSAFHSSDNIPYAFTDTGIKVKNSQNRVYLIIKDRNGFLYYCSDVEGNLAPVLGKNGNPTTDISLFDGEAIY